MVFVKAWSFDIYGDILNCLFEICSSIIIIVSAIVHACPVVSLFHSSHHPLLTHYPFNWFRLINRVLNLNEL